ncbi:MAG: PTS sugar transporter subunit IIA [Cellulomonas sp. 73-145]|uniref:dihydroxyacetone kinase phosphoryl donor subunit DhaM n=1 Tax=Cellulomonas sp. 73-145 TaxID=1895739 RepID=UPI000925AFFE|nr:dihydroxyacetone kinase phosphoryl donor subunit DhaM [Cellulomonas sp. 73-145]MBN9326803.1 PTS-dependent dihydroxyacetone kinase phosphotransferase subunit DhaM [Cellulomonas sp.]OJV59582.1 MAG: PTS sugar transporter subunit IIA [Cellulomonas sp. 73-145]
MTVRVALVLVSHSRLIAEGLAELAGQMAPDVTLLPAGGMPDGGLGTSYDAIEAALEQATADGRSAVVLTDLGSAVMTAQSVLEMLDEPVAERVLLADAPLVEGAVAAAVAAQGGAGVQGVLAAAEGAVATFADVLHPHPGHTALEQSSTTELSTEPGAVRTTVTVTNRLGLHARPAAIVARTVAGFDAHVRLGGVDAASVLQLMALGVANGTDLILEGSGEQAQQAVDAVVALFEDKFGED